MQSDSEPSSPERVRELGRVLRPFARRHTAALVYGIIATLVAVGARVLLPWPIRTLLKPWLHGGVDPADASLPAWLPIGVDPALAAGLILLALLLLLGFADLRKRLSYARFAIAVSRDLRAAAMRAASSSSLSGATRRPGDMIARILGDSARIKTGIRGFLIHVTTNVILLSAVSVVLCRVWLSIGIVFVVAVLVTITVTLIASERIFVRTKRLRKKEGKLAESIQNSWLDRAATEKDIERVIQESSGTHDASLTRLQGLAAWSAHVIFGVAMLCVALLAAHAMRVGAMTPATALVILVYALMVRTPLIQLARQGTRIGKVFGASDRIVALLQSPLSRGSSAALPPLETAITIRDVVIHGGRAHGKSVVLGPLNVTIKKGERVLVCGEAGAGKTTFLELLARARSSVSGSISWDAHDYSSVPMPAAQARFSYCPAEPSWSKQSLRDLLSLGTSIERVDEDILDGSGVTALMKRFPTGLDTVCAGSDLSLRERRTIALARSALRRADLYLWDEPPIDRVAQVLSAMNKATTVVVTAGPIATGACFNRVLHLTEGRLQGMDVPLQVVSEVTDPTEVPG